VAAAGVVWAGIPLARAATLTYDANTTPPANDGTGVWDTTTANWFDGTNDVVWPNTTNDTAIFGAGSGAAGTVTVGASGVTANSITFNAPGSGNYTLSGTLDAGKYKVYVQPPLPEQLPPGQVSRRPPFNVPPRFQDPQQTPISKEVKAGPNDIPIRLSKPQKGRR